MMKVVRGQVRQRVQPADEGLLIGDVLSGVMRGFGPREVSQPALASHSLNLGLVSRSGGQRTHQLGRFWPEGLIGFATVAGVADEEPTNLYRVAVVAIDRQGVWVAAGHPPTAQSVFVEYFPSPVGDAAHAASELAFGSSFDHRDDVLTVARLTDRAGEFDVVALRSTAKLQPEPAFAAEPLPVADIERFRDHSAIRDPALLVAIGDPEFLNLSGLSPAPIGTPGAAITQDRKPDGSFLPSYSCSSPTEAGPREVPLDDALDWARQRSRTIHLQDAHGTFSAGIDRDPELPEWNEPDPWWQRSRECPHF
jgi:hypothetical protein